MFVSLLKIHKDTAQDAQKRAKTPPRPPRDPPRRAKDAPKTAQEAFGAPQHGPKRPQHDSKMPQDAPKRPRHGPKTAPRWAQAPARCTRKAPGLSPRRPERLQSPPGTTGEFQHTRFFTDLEGRVSVGVRVVRCPTPLVTESRLTHSVKHGGGLGAAAPLDQSRFQAFCVRARPTTGRTIFSEAIVYALGLCPHA